MTDRFWAKVEKGEGCWEWLAGRNELGYGRFRVGKRTIGAHRVAWLLTNGPIPDGAFICHRCDNPGCVNPSHLFIGDAMPPFSTGRTVTAPNGKHYRMLVRAVPCPEPWLANCADARAEEREAPWHLRLWRCGKCGIDWLPVGEDRTCPVCALRAQIAADIEALNAGWIAYQRLPENTSHVAFVHENGEVYDPERGWIDPSDILAADAKGCAYPLIERAAAARIARGES